MVLGSLYLPSVLIARALRTNTRSSLMRCRSRPARPCGDFAEVSIKPGGLRRPGTCRRRRAERMRRSATSSWRWLGVVDTSQGGCKASFCQQLLVVRLELDQRFRRSRRRCMRESRSPGLVGSAASMRATGRSRTDGSLDSRGTEAMYSFESWTWICLRFDRIYRAIVDRSRQRLAHHRRGHKKVVHRSPAPIDASSSLR